MALRRLALLLLANLPAVSTAEGLSPFTSDGCSAFPDGSLFARELWKDCCIAHDLAYWRGGSYDERLAADRQLQACVAGHGEPAIGALMLSGVRVGGSPFFPTTFRWGYGWPYLRGYRPLDTEEQQQVDEALLKLDLQDTAAIPVTEVRYPTLYLDTRELRDINQRLGSYLDGYKQPR